MTLPSDIHGCRPESESQRWKGESPTHINKPLAFFLAAGIVGLFVTQQQLTDTGGKGPGEEVGMQNIVSSPSYICVDWLWPHVRNHRSWHGRFKHWTHCASLAKICRIMMSLAAFKSLTSAQRWDRDPHVGRISTLRGSCEAGSFIIKGNDSRVLVFNYESSSAI